MDADMSSIQEDFFGNKGPASTLVGVTAPARRHRDRFALAVVGHELAVLLLLN